MQTIVQTIGPLYGDDVNGTVFGQPNGSVYTPPANILKILQDNPSNAYVKSDSDANVNRTCNSSGVTGVSRVEFAPQIQIEGWTYYNELATDSAFSNIVSTGWILNNNGKAYLGSFGPISDYTVLAGTTYYARTRIVDSLGNTIVTSSTYTLTGVA